MIYILDTSTPVAVMVPRTIAATPEHPVLELVGTADNQRYVIPIDAFETGVLYYVIRADFRAVKAPGEYEYHLTDGDENLAVGIMRLGPVSSFAHIVYENAPQYEQYTAD